MLTNTAQSLTLWLLCVLVCTVSCGPFDDLNAFNYNPVANPKAQVTAGNARFTVLSDYVIRMEYSHTGKFEDRATLMAVNRNLPVPQFTNSSSAGILVIKTKYVTLNYEVGQPFSWFALSASTTAGAIWKFGDVDSGNLLGTIKSLDELCTISLNCTLNANVQVHGESLHCGWGVVSQSGWTIVDDSTNYILSSGPGTWFSPTLKTNDDSDLYFFGHGNNMRSALQDYVNIAGKTPMLHKHQLGAWWTRWYDFDNGDIERLVGIFEKGSVPLDLLVLDMNWHSKNDWTGFSWDRQLYPYPQDTLDFLHHKGLVVAANLHDADGIGSWEDKYQEMCALMGQNPSAQLTIPFQPLNATYMRGVDDVVLTNTGFDLWWIDWQQGGTAGGCPGDQLNPTVITDHVRSTTKMRKKLNERDGILARWGGMGGHRYPVGFSGDVTQLSWECFAFQPYFSVTAANVAYGYISHDLVGPPDDHELHVRWMQFGAFSGIMRIHDRGMSAGGCYPNCAIVNIWKLPFEYFDAIRVAMTARVALLPYIYTAARNGYDSGVPVVYPMYYDYPTYTNAYVLDPTGQYAQYMFGDSILVAPITTASSASGMTSKSIWLPPGVWYDNVFGEVLSGGTGKLSYQYDLEEIPMFFKAGSVVPRIPGAQKVGAASRAYDHIEWHVYPGAPNGSYSLYEDDGTSLDYITNSFATTAVQFVRTSASTITFTVNPTTGTYNGILAQRAHSIVLVGSIPISTVTVNGSPLAYSRFQDDSPSFSYDGRNAEAKIVTGKYPTGAAVTISITLSGAQDDSLVRRAKGFASRTLYAKRVMDNFRETPYSNSYGPGMFKQAGARANQITYAGAPNMSATFSVLVGTHYLTLMQAALQEIAPQVSFVQMWSESRKDMLLCGTQQCMSVNADYQIMWTEGYQPTGGDVAGSTTFFDYWNQDFNDNWADTSSAPNGYTPAVFDNGYVMKAGGANMECLQVWHNTTTNDHMTLASPGLSWAQKNGYVKVEDCIGYVFQSPQPKGQVQDAPTSFAQILLSTVIPVD